jgi:tRNA-binding protein
MSGDSRDLTWDAFLKVEMRVGTITHAEVFEEARKPTYKMMVDFGSFGIRKTSAQVTDLYSPSDLIEFLRFTK